MSWIREKGHSLWVRRVAGADATVTLILAFSIGILGAAMMFFDSSVGIVWLGIAAACGLLFQRLRQGGKPAEINLGHGYVLLPGEGSLALVELSAVRLDSVVDDVSSQDSDGDTSFRRVQRFRVALEQKTGSVTVLSHSRDDDAMLDLALTLCRRLHLPLVDRGHPDNQERLAAEDLERPLGERAVVLARGAVGRPAAVTVMEGDGRLRYTGPRGVVIELDTGLLRFGRKSLPRGDLRLLRLVRRVREGSLDRIGDEETPRDTILVAVGLHRRMRASFASDEEARYVLAALRVALAPPAYR